MMEKNLLSLLAILFCITFVQAKKVLVFDEKQGIIWVDENKKTESKKFEVPEFKKKKVVIEETSVQVRKHVKTKAMTAEDYREAGIKFYSNSDYIEALKYFNKGWELKTDPVDYFWIGACYRKMDKSDDMGRVFNEIMDKYPKSDVADDALFYLAVNAQKNNEYQVAYDRYKEVVEFYPEGVSVIGKFSFREEAKKQLRGMKIDIISRLKLLGYSDNNAPELLKAFQTEHDIEPTGMPDKKTVELLIQMSDDRENKIQNKVDLNESQNVNRVVYYGFLDFLLLFNIIWGIRNLKAAREEKDRLQLMMREIK